MKVSTQKLVRGARKHRKQDGTWVYPNRVERISLDQFLIRARKASEYSLTPRQLLTKLLALPIECRDRECDHDHHLHFVSKDCQTEYLFWLEK